MDHAPTYSRWFMLADTDHDGRVTGADAVQFFSKSGLAKETLAKVWSLSDVARQGYLGQPEFIRAMVAISLAQSGTALTTESVSTAVNSTGQPVALMHGLEYNPAPVAPPPSTAFGTVDDVFNMAPMSSAVPSVQPLMSPELPPPERVPPQHAPPSASTPEAPPPSYLLNLGFTSSAPKAAPKVVPPVVVTSIIDGLKKVYFDKIKPLEAAFKFDAFFGPLLAESDFEAKPSVLLMGQYSTGKTTFIKHLLKREYPGTHIGPEPTTDRFVTVMGGVDERRTPGNTLAVDASKPFTGLTKFGTAFLSKFEAAQCPNPLLENITLVDTPGVLSGEKQRIERSYDFIGVCEWFAARCDVILLLFDPHKLDISDEFKDVIKTLKGHDDKVRVVLNKADQVDMQQLMRVYGALMWSLGKVFNSPEVCRVYVGSFNTEPIKTDKNPLGQLLFEREQNDLLNDLNEIPTRSCDRKVNEFVKRVRAARIHLQIIGHLRKQMPTMMGKKEKQLKLMANMEEEFHKVQTEHHLPPGDFPNSAKFKDVLAAFDLTKFPKLEKKMIQTIDKVISEDIPALLKQFDNPF